MSLGSFRQRPVRRRWVFGTTTTAVAALVVLFVAAAVAVLPGSPSKFESGNDPSLGLGNMIVDTAGNKDWVSVTSDPIYAHVTDDSDATDDSYVSGQKQDTACPEVDPSHSNPPKDDFTDIASFSETNNTTGDTYLYGATIRVAPNGSASENIELKQGTAGSCPGGSPLLARVAGDKLLAIDYNGGGKSVNFHVLTWIETQTEPCFVGNNVAPCWGATVLELSAAGAEGGVSGSDITEANNPISGQALKAGRFAEFGVNLATAGIIPRGTCKSFPQTVWGSRASGSSFVSTTKDISIENKTISNCGQIIIRKVTVPSPDPNDTSFNFTATGGLSPASFSLENGESRDYGSNVPQGNYGVSETPNSNYTLSNIDCSASTLSGGSTVTIGASGGFDAGDTSISMSLKPSDKIDCTYTNTLKTGALVIKKTSTKSGILVLTTGAQFCYSTSTGCTTSNVTDNTSPDADSTVGSVCVPGLAIGTYYVNEVNPPTGYGGASESDQQAVVVAGTNCTNNLPTALNSASFSNPPLANIRVQFVDGGSGETALDAPLDCDNTTGVDTTPTVAGWDNTLLITGVEAGSSVVTITCTIAIDP